MKRRLLLVATALALVLATGAAGHGGVGVGPGGGTPGTSRNFTLVGHDPLFDRGMNAAAAVFDHYVYVGNRTDGSDSCGDFNATGPVVPVLAPTSPDGTCTHVHPGILVVDIADPASPTVVGEFGEQLVSGADQGQTSRELRVWPAQQPRGREVASRPPFQQVAGRV